MKTHKVIVLLTAVVLSAAPSLKAQDADPVGMPGATTWSENVGSQVALLLESSSPAARERGLELALQFVDRDGLDLGAAVPALVAVYRTSDDEPSRLAALTVLHTIGDEEAMREVRRDVARQGSRRVQVATFGALSSYYGTGTFHRDAQVAVLASDLRDHVALAQR